MSLTTIFAYAFALFVVALIPGPGITALVARALGAGRVESFSMALGIVLGDLVFLTAVVCGLSVLAQSFSVAFTVIKYLGVAYLIWMACRMWTQGVTLTEVGTTSRSSVLHGFLSGLFVTLGNPKAMLFYVALVPTLVDLPSLTWVAFLQLIAVTVAVLLVVTVPYVLLAVRARDLFRHPVALRRLNRSSAGFLAASAVYIAVR
jgi:threonine/homoserine/homoserine lactone efflux protein